MNSAYVYLQLYKLFDSITPTKTDCGKACDSACCKGDDCGMYLFPGEQKVYELLEPDWIKIEKSDFKYSFEGKEKNLYIAFCNGSCDRFQRPLACRIFPLTPILTKDGKLEIITDPRSKSICPLGRAFLLDHYDGRFVRNIRRAFTVLMKNKEFYAFMEEYSEYLREFEKFIPTVNPWDLRRD